MLDLTLQRKWLKRFLTAVVALAALYLLAANIFLNTGIAPWAINRRPERFRADWRVAWSLWPGRLEVRGLRLHGRSANRVDWKVEVDRGHARIHLLPLFARRFVVSGFHGEGVRSAVLRGDEVTPPPEPPARRGPPSPPWTIRLDGIDLAGVRDLGYNGLRLTGGGRGRLSGGFAFTFGGVFRLDDTRLAMPGSRLWWNGETISTGLDVDAALAFAPFAPSRHPGLEAWDFLSGSLAAQGPVADLPFLERSGLAGAGDPGRLIAKLRVDQGRLAPGSHAELVLSQPAGAAVPPFTLTADVGDSLRLALQAQGLEAGRIPGRGPAFQSAALAASVQSPVLQLRRLFVTSRELRSASNLSASPPLEGDLRADRVRIDAPGSSATLKATLDRAACRMNFGALLRREIDIQGLQADGVSARLELGRPPGAAKPSGAPPWGARIAGARLTGIREIGIDELELRGASRIEASFSYDRAGNLSVERAAFALPAGSLLVAGTPAASGLAVKAEVRVEPLVLGSAPGLAFLRQVSGSAAVKARISSLGFLDEFLAKVPWLALQGGGNLDALVRLASGRLAPGTRLTVSGARVRATLLDSLASGSGTVKVAVDPASRTTLGVRLDRFGFADLRQPGRPDYLRGRDLRMTAISPASLDLAAPLPDFDASLALTDAEVPDLAVYNALLPEGAGLSIRSGRGRVGLQLALSTATGRTRGMASLSSEAARVLFQSLDIQGRVALQAPFSSPNLQERHFDLDGVRLALDRVSYRRTGDEPGQAPASGWWARVRIADGALVWGQPLSLRAASRLEMKDSGPLIALFSQRSRFVKWFDDALSVEGITAEGMLRIGDGMVAIDAFQARGGNLEVRSRMRFSKTRKAGDLLVRYGRLTAGVELRDGKRDIKLIRAREWFEKGAGAPP
jgi:hypothetical protein